VPFANVGEQLGHVRPHSPLGLGLPAEGTSHRIRPGLGPAARPVGSTNTCSGQLHASELGVEGGRLVSSLGGCGAAGWKCTERPTGERPRCSEELSDVGHPWDPAPTCTARVEIGGLEARFVVITRHAHHLPRELQRPSLEALASDACGAPSLGPRGHTTIVLDGQPHEVPHRFARETQIVDELAKAGGTVEELTARVYPEVGPELQKAARENLRAHLLKLAAEGRATERDGIWHPSP